LSKVKKIQHNALLVMTILGLLLTPSLAVAERQANTQNEHTPLIITTIKPLAIIAKAAVADRGRVEFLQSAAQSAHEVSLPVSAMKKIEQADLIIWIGNGFEARIGKSMALLPETKRITVMDLDLLPARLEEEKHHTDDEDGHHNHLDFDPHIWLNPANANILASIIQQRLELPVSPIISDALVKQLKNELSPVKDKNYLTHHDAFGHFKTAFGLAEGPSVRDANGASQGARSQYELRKKAQVISASCIFVEPQYADKDARIIARELKLPLTVLDPQGFDQPLSAEGYSQFMIGMVAQFKACFD
jgi:zinc transport system substrate-binding protein